MRLFLSYRRDDTAGRAGRLFDSLVQRLGAGSVFQDVASISPGVDFESAVKNSLARTDASIVVIGSEWTTSTGPDGVRRLDLDDDYVRQEVVAALDSGRPVVPVLVGESRMPEAHELPADLRPLLKRQAFSVRDVAWSDDVDGLVRRLRGEVAPGRHRRGLVVVGVAAAAAVLAAAVIFWLWPRDDGTSSDGATLSACSVGDDASWSTIGPSGEPSGTYNLTDGTNRQIGYRATGLRARERQSKWTILVDVEVSNQSTPAVATSADNWYIGAGDFDRIVVDGVAGGPPACFNLMSGALNLSPGQRAIVRLGFDTPTDPRHSELSLETGGPPIPLSNGT